MKKDDLDDLLRTMPREAAPEGFARDVLARLDRPPSRPVTWRLAVAGALATALVVVGGSVWLSRSTNERELRAEIATLRGQYQQLETQLAELRQRLAVAPRVIVGGNDQVDYVLDLERLSAGSQAASDDGDELIWVPRQSFGDSL